VAEDCAPLEGEKRQTEVFVPRAIGGIGYTQAQIDEIEETLAYFGLELLPLDYNLVFMN
jgi:hypothetical protein